jgi:hypothetical protein
VPLLLIWAAGAARAGDWLPISADDLQMTSEPQAPKTAAIYLYRQVDRDDVEHVEKHYVRIKVLTDEGRAHANVTLPFDGNHERIGDIEARTVRPDGSIVPFDGKVYEKPMVEARDVRVMTKSFTLTDVQAGCIIEYRYRHYLSAAYVSDSHWIVSADLYTKSAAFSLVPNRQFSLRTAIPAGLPPGTEAPKFEHAVLRMKVRDVPAFFTEEYMPPPDEFKMRVDFVYMDDSNVESDPAAFWKRYGKNFSRKVERFASARSAMQAAVMQTVTPADAPDQKLRKLYARVQQVRNLSFEPARTAQESERESPKDNDDVGDVWKRGYGNHHQINWLFLGLVRAAGFEAAPVLLGTRNRFLFDPKMENPSQLNAGIVSVLVNGRLVYADPGTPFTPFGTLPWPETGVTGLRLDKDGGVWVNTPTPAAGDSRLDRKAMMHLTADGTLQGRVTFTFTGLEALTRRLAVRNEDDIARQRALEGEFRGEIGRTCDVELSAAPDWSTGDGPLVAVFDVTVPGWASFSGQRALIPMGLFIGAGKHLFEHGVRRYPVYFHFPHQRADDISVELPAGWRVDSLPQPRNTDIAAAKYAWTAAAAAATVQITRELTIGTVWLDTKYYGQLQEFYQAVRASDEEQGILAMSAAARPN